MSKNALERTMTPRQDERFAHALGKPAYRDKCNGCGYCCLMVPCLISQSLFGQDIASCPALEFKDGRYHCGLMIDPAVYQHKCLPDVPKLETEGQKKSAAKYIRDRLGAGMGCDARHAGER